MLTRRVLLSSGLLLWLGAPAALPAAKVLTIAISATLGPVLRGSDPLKFSGQTGSVTIQASESLAPVSHSGNSATYSVPPGAITVVFFGKPYTTTMSSGVSVKLTPTADVLTIAYSDQSSTGYILTASLAAGSWNRMVLFHPLPFSPTPQLLTAATTAGGPGSEFTYRVSGGTMNVLGLNGSASSGDVPPPGSCQPSSSLSVLVSGKDVVAYVPKGDWGGGATGLSAVNIEGSSITPTLIPTPAVVNSCASNALTGETVCTANTSDVYLIGGTKLRQTVTSSGTGTIAFSGGSCTNCGVAMDASHNKAVIGLSLAGIGGFQYLDMNNSTFEPAFPVPTGAISEDALIDPIRNFLLSASESGDYEIINVTTTTSPAFFENPTGAGKLDTAGEDCTTGIALAPVEYVSTAQVFVADLTQAGFTPRSPGVWLAPAQLQTLSEATTCAYFDGLAVAQGTHTAVLSGEFDCGSVIALALPTTSGTGTPAIQDWVTCAIPGGFIGGDDPHTVTAYQSPNTGHAVAVVANQAASMLAAVDITEMLNTKLVPRTTGGHACAAGTLPGAVVTFVSVP